MRNTDLGKFNIVTLKFSMTDFNFKNTFNMGYEGFSKPVPLPKQNPISGNRGEFIFLFGFIVSISMLMRGRKKNENKLRKINVSTNRYAEFPLNN